MGGAQQDNNDESNEAFTVGKLDPHTDLRNIETFVFY